MHAVPVIWSPSIKLLLRSDQTSKVVNYLTDVAVQVLVEGRTEEGETEVFTGELVGVMDVEVASFAERCLVGGAVNRRLFLFTNVALDLHSLSLYLSACEFRVYV